VLLEIRQLCAYRQRDLTPVKANPDFSFVVGWQFQNSFLDSPAIRAACSQLVAENSSVAVGLEPDACPLVFICLHGSMDCFE
jgi:hypothetical protein